MTITADAAKPIGELKPIWRFYGADAAVNLKIGGLPLKNISATLTQHLIGVDRSNSYEAWLKMGSPLPLNGK